jgi:hypothetical protein
MEANVATTADSYSLKRGPAKPPISTHPAFPAIVALWFAALLGLGSLVLPIALLERIVTVTGIAALIPSAAPPLGFTAHAGIALAGAIAGAALGLILARRIARAHAAEPSAREFHADEAEPRRPISAHDELGEEGLAPAFGSAPPLLAQKRRSLAMAEDNRRSAYLEAVPLPGHSPERPADHTADVEPAHDAEDDLSEPLELGEFSDLDEADDDQPADIEADPALEALRSRIHVPVEPTSSQEPQMTDTYSFDQAADDDREGERQEFIPIEAVDTAADAHDPLPFAPPSLRRLEPTFDEDEDQDMADEPVGDATPQLSAVEFAEPDFDEDGGPDRPLDELGLVQLAARLGASLKKRRARLAADAPALPTPALAAIASTEDFEAAEAEDAARAIADFFSAGMPEQPTIEADIDEPKAEAPPMPVPLRSFAVETDEDADDEAFAASFSLPLGATQACASPADEANEDEDTDEDDGEYSSLLAMNNPFARQQEFVRVEEPESDDDAFEPAVSFPRPPESPAGGAPEAPNGSSSRPFDPPRTPANPAAPAAPRDAGDAERSLRDALATLQRMSGAA